MVDSLQTQFGLRTTICIVALVGCVISAALIIQGASTSGSEGIALPFCSAGPSIQCSAVLHSEWAHFGIIPTSLLGLVYFLFMLVWFAVVGFPNLKGRAWHLVPTIAALIGIVISIRLSYVMLVRLPAWCPWCLVTHVINLVLLALIGLGWRTGTAPLPEASSPLATQLSYPSPLRACLTLGGSFAGGLIMLLMMLVYIQHGSASNCQRSYLDVTNSTDYIAWRYSQAPVKQIPLRGDEFQYGIPEASNILVVFTDFECTKCAEFHAQAARLVSQFPKDLRCIFKHYPMSKVCNSYVTSEFHQFSCDAAYAAETVISLGGLKKKHDYWSLLFSRAREFAEKPYIRFAEQLGLNASDFARVLVLDKTHASVRSDIELGHQLGVEGTPALFLNGRQLSNWRIVQANSPNQLDSKLTVALWEKLLGVPAEMNRTKPSATTAES